MFHSVSEVFRGAFIVPNIEHLSAHSPLGEFHASPAPRGDQADGSVFDEKQEMQIKTIEAVPWKFTRMLALAVVLLSGCATINNVHQSCKVIDPDLAQGTYSGGCRDGWADGYGEVSGVGSYRGGFQAGKKHGIGIKVMPNGDRYAGYFSEDYRHGKGVYVWGDKTQWAGDRYEGEYQRDLRHGWGVFQWGSGDRYEGPWQNDLRMGPSVMEVRRTQAAEAFGKSARVGWQVCVEAQLGLVSRQHIRGKVESTAGGNVQVRIVEVEGGVANYQGRVVKAGDVLSDVAASWQPCAQN